MSSDKPTKPLSQAEMMRQKGYLPAPVVARAVGRDISSIYRWIEADHIKAEQIGRSWYVERESLLAYLGPSALTAFPTLADLK